ncbi:hypothetical protein CASFOL_021004 [Castilleja foliolosa]|uniref:RING-type E3 ubiquitin transferase n=1 Tax=Castilleja foliolosa TaxID=1961234 RepID=A0ABD3D417_9LAMI
METSEIETNLLSIGEPKLHVAMCRSLCAVYVRILALFPDLEAARPRSTSGIQALCSLHIALEKTKNVLQHCADCSKLYLAITGDAVVMKFERTRRVLADSLTRVEDIVPRAIGSQIAEIIGELTEIEFSLDPTEKQTGDDIIVLLQKGKNIDTENSESDFFHQSLFKLGITSSRAALRERRALKKLIERARADEDKRKESIIAYLLHLMKKHSKLFKSDLSDEIDSQGSTPRSPTGNIFDRKMSKLSSLNYNPNTHNFPPEELRCPISLQLMYDPVIICSGQTYERVFIEKWFDDGHNTCPKTQQELSHLYLTPNYCVKGLVASWCEQNGLSVPDEPPVSRDINYWRLVLSESDSMNSKSIGSCKFNSFKVVPSDDCEEENNEFERYEDFLAVLEKGDDELDEKCRVVEKIRHLLRDDEEARICMGANGFVESLLWFLESAFCAGDERAQEIGAMALFNLALNNNRNKESMLASGVLQTLQKMSTNNVSVGAATALYMNLSCLDDAKPILGNSETVPFLISILNHENDIQCKLDALDALYNISTHPPNIPHLVSSGIIDALQTILTHLNDQLTEKCISILIYLASSEIAKEEITTAYGLVTGLATVLDVGGSVEQEQAVMCLLTLCNANEKCSQMVLQEGVIPSLVSISVNGTTRGRQKARKLLMLFREQRQRDLPACPESYNVSESGDVSLCGQESIPSCKPVSRRKLGKGLSFWKKNKSFSVL